MKKNVLVTGCTGLVGHGVCQYLLDQGYEVWGTSRKSIQSNHPSFHPVILDLGAEDFVTALSDVLPQIDTVIHNAALRPGTQENIKWDDYYRVNFLSTKLLLEEAVKNKVPQFIFISGTAVLDNNNGVLTESAPYLPANDYITSKIIAEMACLQAGHAGSINVCILRFPAPYGYRNVSKAVLPSFIDKVKAGEPIKLWGTGSRQQIFTFVDDIARACESAMNLRAKNIYHITGPGAVTMKQLAETVLEVYAGTGSSIHFENIPDPQENRRIHISIEKAEKELKFKPVSLSEGLSRIKASSGSVSFFK